jgi:hypothetical protein
LRFSFRMLSSTGLSSAEDTLPLSQVFGSEHHNDSGGCIFLENQYATILPPDFPETTKGTQQ